MDVLRSVLTIQSSTFHVSDVILILGLRKIKCMIYIFQEARTVGKMDAILRITL